MISQPIQRRTTDPTVWVYGCVCVCVFNQGLSGRKQGCYDSEHDSARAVQGC